MSGPLFGGTPLNTADSQVNQTLQQIQQAYDRDPQGTMQQIHNSGMDQYVEVQNGRVTAKRQFNFIERHPWLLPAAFAAPAILTAAGPAAAAGGVTATSSGAGGTLPASGFVGATSLTTPTVAGASLAGGGAAAAPSILHRILQAAVPSAFTAITAPHGNGGGGANGANASGLTPELEKQLNDLLAFQSRRLGRQEPVQEAAMHMAQNFAGRSPNMPRPQSTSDPQVLDAIRRLTSGVG